MKLWIKFNLGIIAIVALLAVSLAAVCSGLQACEDPGRAVRLYLLATAAGMILLGSFSYFFLRESEHRQTKLEAESEDLRSTNHNYMEVLGFVAHELKNPLASAVISLYTVKDGYLGEITPSQRKSLAAVARSLEDLQDMIRNYLDLSRLEMGGLEITKTYFPLHDRVIQPILAELEGELHRRQMTVEDCIAAGKVVYADAALLKIVYGNLLSNAVKYGLEGGRIHLEAQENGRTVTLSVCNDSSGIPPDQIAHLFRKFSRLPNPEHANQRGTGLGLYICREIVAKHGGAIWADSRMGEWVKFSFTLPKEEVR
jgi:signal transduction histidine kinase